MGYILKEMKKVQSYATRMEGSLKQIQVKFPGMISDAEAKIKLKDRLFYGGLKTLRDSIWYLYDNQTLAYTQLLVAARKAEAEVSDSKVGTMTIKAKAINLVAMVKANHVCENSKKTTQQNDQKNDN